MNNIEILYQKGSLESSNYDKVIRILLDGLTSLTIFYNNRNMKCHKRAIKADIAVLEEMFRLKALCRETITDRDYINIRKFVHKTIRSYYKTL